MASAISTIETQARRHIVETSASYWSSAEVIDIIQLGIKDLWRDMVDLKQEYFLTRDNTNVSLAANTATLTGVPSDVHKVYLIEPRDTSTSSSNEGLIFQPLDYNHARFIGARAADDIDPSNDIIYYAVTGAGGPFNAATIYVAPQVTSAVNLSFVYIPTLADSDLDSGDNIPLPGEVDNALIAWTVAFARAKEREDRSPDPNWLAVYATEKQHLMQSLGLRQYQEPSYVDALYEAYW